jgi:hypothetical protein
MKKSRLSLEAFGNQAVKNTMLNTISGGRVTVVQEYCHPADTKNIKNTPRVGGEVKAG